MTLLCNCIDQLEATWNEFERSNIQVICLLHTPRSGALILGDQLADCGFGFVNDDFDAFARNCGGSADVLIPLLTRAQQLVHAARGRALIFKLTATGYAGLSAALSLEDPALRYFD